MIDNQSTPQDRQKDTSDQRSGMTAQQVVFPDGRSGVTEKLQVTWHGEMPSCPHCNGQDLWRRGRTVSGIQRWFCKSCERQFHVDPQAEIIRHIAVRLITLGNPVSKVSEAFRGYLSERTLYRMKKEYDG